eukprot:Opistho-2@66158
MAEAVKVIVRCRPLNAREKGLNCNIVVDMDSKIAQVAIKNPEEPNELPKTFTFDSVYGIDSNNRMIYDDFGFPMVESVMAGYNGTVFAYGQTGCGKTFTMSGLHDPPEHKGIIPSAFEHIFEQIAVQEATQFLIRASYLEIYNEEIRDLLGDNPKARLELKQHPDTGVYVKGLSHITVKSVEEIEQAMTLGYSHRTTGATLMNQESSRSHSIFTITIEASEMRAEDTDGKPHIRSGKLNLVDLAGSERQEKTGATGQRLKEATKINLSLSALGNVISALVDSNAKHIPYRDSKLTRLLEDSLGGNTKTLMVACVSPADNNYLESLSTLRYANRAKNIKNKPKINEDPKDALLREYQEEIMRLKAMLEAQGMSLPPGMGAALGGGAAPASRATAAASSSQASAPVTQTVTQTVVQLVPDPAAQEELEHLKGDYEKRIAELKKKHEEEQMTNQMLQEQVELLKAEYTKQREEVQRRVEAPVAGGKQKGVQASKQQQQQPQQGHVAAPSTASTSSHAAASPSTRAAAGKKASGDNSAADVSDSGSAGPRASEGGNQGGARTAESGAAPAGPRRKGQVVDNDHHPRVFESESGSTGQRPAAWGPAETGGAAPGGSRASGKKGAADSNGASSPEPVHSSQRAAASGAVRGGESGGVIKTPGAPRAVKGKPPTGKPPGGAREAGGVSRDVDGAHAEGRSPRTSASEGRVGSGKRSAARMSQGDLALSSGGVGDDADEYYEDEPAYDDEDLQGGDADGTYDAGYDARGEQTGSPAVQQQSGQQHAQSQQGNQQQQQQHTKGALLQARRTSSGRGVRGANAVASASNGSVDGRRDSGAQQTQGGYDESDGALINEMAIGPDGTLVSLGASASTAAAVGGDAGDVTTGGAEGALQSQVDLMEKLRLLQERLVKGGHKANDNTLKQKMEIKSQGAKRKIEELREALQTTVDDDGKLEVIYGSMQDELKDKNKRLKLLRDKNRAAKKEIEDLQREFESEREDLLDTIRRQDMTLKLNLAILERVVPCLRRDCNYYNIDRIRNEAVWDEESELWKLPVLTITRTELPTGPADGLSSGGGVRGSLAQLSNGPNGYPGDYEYDDRDAYRDHLNRNANDSIPDYFGPKRAREILAKTTTDIDRAQQSGRDRVPDPYAPSVRADAMALGGGGGGRPVRGLEPLRGPGAQRSSNTPTDDSKQMMPKMLPRNLAPLTKDAGYR